MRHTDAAAARSSTYIAPPRLTSQVSVGDTCNSQTRTLREHVCMRQHARTTPNTLARELLQQRGRQVRSDDPPVSRKGCEALPTCFKENPIDCVGDDQPYDKPIRTSAEKRLSSGASAPPLCRLHNLHLHLHMTRAFLRSGASVMRMSTPLRRRQPLRFKNHERAARRCILFAYLCLPRQSPPSCYRLTSPAILFK